MKMQIKYLVIFCLTAGWLNMTAQQDPMFSQYMFNMLTVNPAYAGSADLTTANIIYRHQWVEFDGAPVTQTLTMHSPLKRESISVGGSLVNDSHGKIKQTAIFGDVSYRIFLDRSKIAFGLKAGISLFQADLLSVNTVSPDDPAFQQNIKNRVLPNFGTGIMWYSDKSYVGLSAPRLLSNKLLSGNLPDFNNNRERQHFFLTAGTVLEINNYLYFKPTATFRAVNGAPPSFDFTANFMFYERFWAGAMYRYQESMGMLLQYEINNQLRVGYAYDYPLMDIGNYSIGSHEVMLGVDFGKKAGADISPRFF